MTIRNISIKGFRSFKEPASMELGIPNGEFGSGLTIIVGPNNAGKSTIIEAFHVLSKERPSSIPEGKRNKIAEDRISIQVTDTKEQTIELRTVDAGGSLTEWKDNIMPFTSNVFVLPSRRTFNPFFSRSENKFADGRNTYIQNQDLPMIRGLANDSFTDRIFGIQERKDIFNRYLADLLNYIPEWKIEQTDKGEYYMKFDCGGITHNSDGLGEGVLSIFFIVDSLYDSKKDNIIVIDEPELSLHPSLQKKLAKLFAEFAADRQIILATHSPYFISWESIENGAKITRVIKDENTTKLYQMSNDLVRKIKKFRKDLNNPHIFGLNANEVFFLEDGVILVEGQEDVVFYNMISDLLNIKLDGEFFG